MRPSVFTAVGYGNLVLAQVAGEAGYTRGALWAVEGAVIALAGLAPYDESLAVRTAAGVLGLDTPAS